MFQRQLDKVNYILHQTLMVAHRAFRKLFELLILRKSTYFVIIHLLYIGIDKFFELVKDAEIEYEKDYRIEYERLRNAKREAEKVSYLAGLRNWGEGFFLRNYNWIYHPSRFCLV